MNNSLKTVLAFVIFAVFIGGAYLAYNALAERNKPSATTAATTVATTPASQPGSASSGETAATTTDNRILAPDFTVYDASGNAVSLSDFLGKPVVLNFWASWCPPCKDELPDFDLVAADMQGDVVFMMVDLTDGSRETQADGQAYVDSKGFTFPVYFDLELDAAATYGISSIPTTIFIDAEGYAVTGYQGAIDEATLRAAIELIR